MTVAQMERGPPKRLKVECRETAIRACGWFCLGAHRHRSCHLGEGSGPVRSQQHADAGELAGDGAQGSRCTCKPAVAPTIAPTPLVFVEATTDEGEHDMQRDDP